MKPMRLRDLPKGHPVVVDTEASGLHWDDGATVSIVSYAFRCPQTRKVVSGALPFDQGWHGKELEPRHLKRIEKWSEEDQNDRAPNLPAPRYLELLHILRRFRLVFHNAKYDLHMLRTGIRGQPGVDLEPNFFWCTFLTQNVLESQYPLGLAAVATRHGLGSKQSDAMKPYLGPKTDARYDLVPWKVSGPYAGEDAVLTLLLFELQMEQLNEPGYTQLWKHFHDDHNLCRCLYWGEWNGIGYDGAKSLEMAKLLREKRAEVAATLPFKATPPGAKKFFFGNQADCVWCEGEYAPGCACFRKPYPGKVTDTCKKEHWSLQGHNCYDHPQLDSEVQELLVQDEVPWAKEYLFHENLKAAESKWYRPWGERVGKDGRLRGTFRQARVVTGRLSAERVNLLAIPKDKHMPPVPGLATVRSLFRPATDKAHWSIDAGQAEVRVGAHVSECVPLLEGFSQGIDAHSRACQLIFEVDLSDPDWGNLRSIAKTLNLAIQYGAGVRRIRAQLEKDTKRKWKESEVKGFIQGWHKAFPEMSAELRYSKEEVERQGYVRLWNGRIRWFDHQRGGPPEPPYSAFNAKCQGGVAEVMKQLMWQWENRHPGTLLVQTHDALLIEVPKLTGESLAQEAADLMVDCFETAMTKTWESGEVVRFPFKAEIERFG